MIRWNNPPTHDPNPSARITPRSPERYAIQLTVSKETHDRLRHVQALFGHTVAWRDLETVFDRALVLLEKSLERQRFAATERPGRSRQSKRPRHIPAQVKRAVWARDGGQCGPRRRGARAPAIANARAILPFAYHSSAESSSMTWLMTLF